MEHITIIIIGTTHETNEEKQLFDELNNIIKNKTFKNTIWLCEGESDDRQCSSLKDHDIHLLTDSLFVRMMIIDTNQIDKNTKKVFLQTFYDRIFELFITISRSSLKNKIMEEDTIFRNCIKLLEHAPNLSNVFQTIDNCLTKINIETLMDSLNIFIKKIIQLIFENNILSNKYFKCVNNFYNTGSLCENEIMTVLREESFIKIIMAHVMNILKTNDTEKHILILTVGRDHVVPLCDFLKNNP
jgi:hypothetical protein